MNNVQPSTGVSTQEEADTLITLHAAKISKFGKNVDIMTYRCYGPCSSKTHSSWSSDNHAYGNRWQQEKSFAETNDMSVLGYQKMQHLRDLTVKQDATHVDILRYRQEDCHQGLHWSNTNRTHSTKVNLVLKKCLLHVVLGCERFFVQAPWHKKDLQANTAEKLRWKRFQSQPAG